MKKIREIICVLASLVAALSAVPWASANNNFTDANSKLNKLLPEAPGSYDGGSRSLPTGDLQYDIVPAALKMFFGVSGAITTVVFVYAGVMLVTNMDNEEAITKFKRLMVWSIVGLGFVTTAYGIVTGIVKLFKS